jgi:hypothetical protein
LSCIHILRHAVSDGLGQTLWTPDLINDTEGVD